MAHFSTRNNRFLGFIKRLHDFNNLSQEVETEFLKSIHKKNDAVILTAAVLTILIETGLIIRIFTIQPNLATLSSRVYFALYLLLILISAAALLLRPRIQGNAMAGYQFAFAFSTLYLIWNLLLNTYDLSHDKQNSSLSMVMAMVFVSILLQFKPLHTMSLHLCIYGLFCFLNRAYIEDGINASISVTVAILSSFLFYYRQVQSVHSQLQIQQMRMQIENEQLEGARRYLRRLQSAQTKTAIYHHDMRHTFHLLNQLLQNGDYKKMHTIIAEHEVQLEAVKTNFYCAHETANLLFGSFEERARSHDIAFRVEATLPQALPLNDTEFCALLCNLLENALNATQNDPSPTQHRIYVRAIYNAPNLVLFVENTFHNAVNLVQDRPTRTAPAPQHGFGVQSIVDIVERYHGLYDFSVDGKVFRAKVLLKTQRDATPMLE